MKPQPITTAYDLTTGRGRLSYVANVVLPKVTMEKLPFDLSEWFAEISNPHDCGTAACACGWAARDPLLAAVGLAQRHGNLAFGGKNSWCAVQCFFDLRVDEAYSLFDVDHYPPRATAADVADRIRAHLAETEGV